jgi:hypothetical protein
MSIEEASSTEKRVDKKEKVKRFYSYNYNYQYFF